jgi:cell division protein FtsQ
MHTNIANVEINIFRNNENGFINSNQILSSINDIDSINKIQISKVKNIDIEQAIMSNPYVDKVDSYVTIVGNLLVNVKEKQPIIRIYESGGQSYYLDEKGDIFPICQQYAPRVIIANGYIKEIVANPGGNITDSVYNKSVFKELFELTKLINKNSLLKAQINQIYVNSKGNFDLVPELGNHLIQFGTMEDAETKIRNLDAYYKKYLKTSIWDSYKTINLTYKNQIVCTKK